ncbi:MAG: DUF4974 domain-containing protein [Chitinophagaceae bacterium]|jgi:ferric-dicitrate binding protein FerR (iron transport regulator)|nr:MAG: DUF4974 domain-containing protein [Chitinophagaceae bacterium]
MSPISRELLKKYIQGKCSEEEEQMVHHWLDESDLNNYWSPAGNKKIVKKKERNWNHLTAQIAELRTVAPEKRNTRRIWVGIAAAAVGIVLVASFMWSYWSYNSKEIKYQTTYGEIKKISLPDGTTVTLNAQSSLSIRQDFDNKSRNVYLDGEAYFQVKHEANKLFVVHAGKLSVKVLGTSFAVSAFPNDPDVAVSLKEGKVLVEAPEHQEKRVQHVILTPGEQAVFTKNTTGLEVDKLNPKASFGWESQDIFFENANIDEVLRKLERYYGVSFDTQLLKSRHWQLTGEYKNETLQEVLESLSFNYNLKYKIEGQKVILYEQ